MEAVLYANGYFIQIEIATKKAFREIGGFDTAPITKGATEK